MRKFWQEIVANWKLPPWPGPPKDLRARNALMTIQCMCEQTNYLEVVVERRGVQSLREQLLEIVAGAT